MTPQDQELLRTFGNPQWLREQAAVFAHARTVSQSANFKNHFADQERAYLATAIGLERHESIGQFLGAPADPEEFG